MKAFHNINYKYTSVLQFANERMAGRRMQMTVKHNLQAEIQTAKAI
jgi:hypothetical protein